MAAKSGLVRRWVAYTVFFLSGVAALVYEISWSRQIGLLFGHTVHAASIVLASYFAGMAIGYLVGARWSSRVRPLVGYAVAELAVAAWAFAIPLLLGLSESSAIAPWFSNASFYWQTATRALFSFLLLLPATVALGVTLPMMAEFLSGREWGSLKDPTTASRVSLAYALNTAGALAGVLAATFYLLVVVGVCGSSYLAAGLSAFCAIAALAMRGKGGGQRQEGGGQRQEGGGQRQEGGGQRQERPMASPIDFRLILLAAISGFGTLGLQVLYTRMFSLVFHNSTYTFGIVVAVFLASLAIGAGLAAFLQRWLSPRRLIGIAIGCGGLATASSVLVFVWWTELRYFSYGDTFSEYIGGAIGLVAAVVGPPIICLAVVLPLVWKWAGEAASAGRVVGNLTAVNTIASATGAMAASFLLLPLVGLWPSMVLLASIFVVASFVLLWGDGAKRAGMAVAFGLVAVSFFVLRSPIESEYNREKFGEELVKRWNSPYGWIDVVQRKKTGDYKIRQNLHYRFGTTGNNAREFRQAHIPLLLHEDPSDVLFMGLGTGLTAGGAVPDRAVKRLVAVELIPEVVEATRMLSEYNFNIVDAAKVEVYVDDARHYLLAHDRQFDVIVSDLFVPWESESGYLYTAEHYRVASQRLKPGGLFCQWLPLYQVGTREFEMIANSFSSVFPQTTIWWGQLESSSPMIALIGSESRIEVDANRLSLRLDELASDMGSRDPTIANVHRFWDLYLGDWEYQPGSVLNTDEHPRVEFLTPITNRDRNLIRGLSLERYFNDVLVQLPAGAAWLRGGREIDSVEQRRLRQRVILFGR